MGIRAFVTGTAFAVLATVIGTHARATTVFIDAGPTGWGCTTCFGGPASLGSGPGQVVTLVNQGKAGPLQLTLAAGTYEITNAATSGHYSAWRYDGGNDWAWSFVIGKDLGNGTAEVLHVGWVNVPNHNGQAGAANATNVASYRFLTQINPSTSTAAYYDTFTLLATTTLDFWMIDGFLPDNFGGVALNIQPLTPSEVPLPAALPLFASILAGGGVLAWRRKRNSAKATAAYSKGVVA